MKKDRKEQLKKFTQVMEISFHDLNLLDRALTHSSYANENKNKHVQHNERLEFLGDAILDLVVGEYLFKTYPEMPEGELSKARASVVSESPLAVCCAGFHVGDYILLGNGELASGGRSRASILADAFEAVVGAIYIDSSYEAARNFILYQLRTFLALVESGHYGKDYKTVFQEFIQRDGEQKIDYELCREEGPDHDKTFYMEVIVNGKALGEGSGKTKKDAEQQAAHKALEKLHALY
ncbi:MAG: ribonuclease III [Megasphaera sp.]|jgi:ribonuclease-3|uniref:ribonuclease III n=1 Tax=Megasphaera sueciensis TaxID=349094 RepID=UPI003CFFA8A0|nr:ribonuclease III [Megasphaera sp.]MCI1823675.1 ribonuclease III [Megasphaera sp.]